MDPLLNHPGRGLAHLRSTLRALELYHLCLRQINSLGLNHCFSISDTQPIVAFGVRSFALTELVAHGIYGTAQLVARFIHCAAHGIDLTSPIAEVILVSIPTESLLSVGMTMPNISAVIGYPNNPFLRLRFHSRPAAIHAAELFCAWIDYYIYWLAECIRRSIKQGNASRWKFGVALGVGTVGFLAIVEAAGPAAPVEEGQDRVADEVFHCTTMDMEVARFIRPWFTHFGVMEGPTQIAVAFFPIDYPLASPMDAVMHEGYQKMELDYLEVFATRGRN